MALVHTTAVRNGLADYTVDQLDVGSADATGDLQIATSSAFTTILATILFANPAFGAASGGVATMASPPKEDSNAAGGGTAANFRVRNRDNTEIFRGTVTVTAGGGDMELSSTTINAGDAVRINSFTYTAPP